MYLILLFAQIVIRSFSSIVTFLFGWVVITFSGNLPAKVSRGLSVLAALGVIWWYLLISILWPPIFRVVTQIEPQIGPRRALIHALTLPSLLLIPMIAGGVLLYMSGTRLRPLHAAIPYFRQGLRTIVGYGLAVPFMLFSAAARVVSIYLYRLQIEHMPIELFPGGYSQVLRDMRATLNAGNYPVTPRKRSWTIRLPIWLLDRLTPSLHPYIITRDTYALVDTKQHLSITMHPYDIMIAGRDNTPAAVHIVLAEALPMTSAFLTWTPDAQAVETRIRALHRHWQTAPTAQQEATVQDALNLRREAQNIRTISYAEWSVLYRLAADLERRVSHGEK